MEAVKLMITVFYFDPLFTLQHEIMTGVAPITLEGHLDLAAPRFEASFFSEFNANFDNIFIFCKATEIGLSKGDWHAFFGQMVGLDTPWADMDLDGCLFDDEWEILFLLLARYSDKEAPIMLVVLWIFFHNILLIGISYL